MKIGILSDIHAHEHPDFAKMVLHNGIYINSRLEDILHTLWNCFDIGHMKGVSRWLILGDVFHTRMQVPTVVRNTMWDLLCKAHKEYGCDFQILVGNHDQADRDGNVHSLHEWENDFVTIIDSTLEVDNTFFIPFMASHEDLTHCLDRTDPAEDGSSILCMHAGVDGSAIGTMEYRIKDPLTVEDLHPERYAWVFLGHYHKPQALADNVLYVGSPCQLTRAEAGDKKRFLIYDTKSSRVTSVRTRCKEFYTVTWPECSQGDAPVDGYYDVVVEDGSSPDDIRAYYGEYGITSVKIIVPPKADNVDSRIEVDETTTDKDLVAQYCEHKTGSPHEALIDMGVSFLSQTQGAVASNLRIKFLNVHARNFLSLSKADLILNQPGSVIAVLGENKDAEGFKSNGSGKSSLLPESLFWCLFGETARNLPADKVVNNVRKRNCLVSVTMKIDKQIVQVTRARKHTEYGSALYVSVDNKDMTQGTNAATQAYLEQMLGMDYTTFSSVVAFSPDTLRFVNSKDSEQKAVLDSILQTQRFGEALKLAQAGYKTAGASCIDLAAALTRLGDNIQHLSDNISVIKEDLETERQEKKEWNAKEKQAIQELETARAKAVKDLIVLQKELQALTPVERVDTAELTATHLQASTVLAGLTATKASQRKDLERIQKELDHIMEQEGKPCPTCGQLVQNLAKMKTNLSTQLREKTGEMDATSKRVQEAITAKTHAQSKLNEATVANQEADTWQEATSELAIRISKLKNQITQCDDLLTTRAAYNDSRIDTLKDRLSEAKGKRAELQDQETQLQAEQEVATNQAYLCKFWVEGFGNKGLKSFLLDNILPHLTQYAQTFADRLTGNSVEIKFSTVSATGIDRFGVTAINNEGSDIYAGNSSGEKRRIDLAVMFALFMLANARVKLNLMLMDECLDTLDATGIDTVVEILEEMAQKRKLTIFITSHTELADRLHEAITVVKCGGLSTLKA